ncbi:DUF2997 domain-containing protein [Microbacterium phosphatis]|uniref:DUF2997 domain-containing protein n=1 Tax=Microbacterium phosphatis TaxID=3140248 RepID=UPI003140782D
MTKQLIVRVHKDGTIDAETIGMHGAECLDYFEALEDLLGASTAASAYTADYDRATADDEWHNVDHDHTQGHGG